MRVKRERLWRSVAHTSHTHHARLSARQSSSTTSAVRPTTSSSRDIASRLTARGTAANLHGKHPPNVSKNQYEP